MTEDELRAKLLYLFADQDHVNWWLNAPKRTFEGRTPLQVLRMEGGSEVLEEWVRKMEQGFIY